MRFCAIFAAQSGPHRKNPPLPSRIAPSAPPSSGLTMRQHCGAFCIDPEQAMASKLRFLHQFKTKPKPRFVLLTRGESPLSGVAAPWPSGTGIGMGGLFDNGRGRAARALGLRC
jgi:hypothetical protein